MKVRDQEQAIAMMWKVFISEHNPDEVLDQLRKPRVGSILIKALLYSKFHDYSAHFSVWRYKDMFDVGSAYTHERDVWFALAEFGVDRFVRKVNNTYQKDYI